jgi:SH3-like domain-containing protein
LRKRRPKLPQSPTDAPHARRDPPGKSPRPALAARVVLMIVTAFAFNAAAADFRATNDPATVLFDAPSARAKPLFVYGRDVPVESLVTVEGWTKIRDASGTIGWMQSKLLSDKRMVVVRAPVADVRAAAEEGAPVVFRAERDVLLEIAEAAASPSTTQMPGWIKVRHRDGQAGYVRLSQVFGF